MQSRDLAVVCVGGAIAGATIFGFAASIDRNESNNQTEVRIQIVQACASQPDPVDCGKKLADAVNQVE